MDAAAPPAYRPPLSQTQPCVTDKQFQLPFLSDQPQRKFTSQIWIRGKHCVTVSLKHVKFPICRALSDSHSRSTSVTADLLVQAPLAPRMVPECELCLSGSGFLSPEASEAANVCFLQICSESSASASSIHAEGP